MDSLQTAAGSRRIRVPLQKIVPGRNPRTHFDEAALDRLAANIDAVDIIQDPVVTFDPARGVYPLVAGERRTRAARRSQRYGETGEIWVVVRDSDEPIDAMSLSENTERESMTKLEEAEAAAKMLAQSNNDRDAAAAALGWKRDVLDRRLGLMNATAAVRDALRTQAIFLGHAELLATMRREAQDATLKLLLERKTLATVAELKAMLERAALVLDQAIFDRAECTTCSHNSSYQPALFAEVISGGKCTNKDCFDKKTEAELEARAEALKADFQVVRIVRPGENFTTVPLVADGPKGVGEEQAKNCRMCKDFGAVVSGVPDKLGKTFTNMCLNVVCNVKMVADNVKRVTDAAKAAAVTPKGATAASPASSKAGSVSKSQGDGAAEGKVDLAQPRQAIKDYREKLWRRIFKEAVYRLTVQQNRAVLVALCMTRPAAIDSGALTEDASKIGEGMDRFQPVKLAKRILDLDQKALGELVQRIASNVGAGQAGLELKDVTGFLKLFDVKVADYWKIGKPFFELLTRNEIDVVAEEIGLKKHMGAEYAKAKAGSKSDYVEALLRSSFDYTGKIPKFMDLVSAPR